MSSQHMGIAVAVIAGARSSGKVWGGDPKRAREGREREHRHASSIERQQWEEAGYHPGGLDTRSA